MGNSFWKLNSICLNHLVVGLVTGCLIRRNKVGR